MITTIHSFKLNGIEAVPITVETQVTDGIGIHIVGLADAAVKESLLRTVTALQSYGYKFPGRKTVINIAPADLVKMGAGYDLPIALGILSASGQIPAPDLDKYIIAGELGLDGSVRDIPGWMQAATLAKETGKACILPEKSALWAADATEGGIPIYAVNSLAKAVEIVNGNKPEFTAYELLADRFLQYPKDYCKFEDAWDKVSQPGARRAIEIAAAGGHPMLLVGSPGSGKQTLAKALNQLLPMTRSKADETISIYSALGKGIEPGTRPFRTPHYSASIASLLGGGVGGGITPGEVSLAHNGVLFFDDFNLAPSAVKEALRAPLEDGKVVISRLRNKVEFPARFFPVFSIQPCPCGHYGEGDRCTCTPTQRALWLEKVSGPVYDRLTMQYWVRPDNGSAPADEPGWEAYNRVMEARRVQMERQGCLNDELRSQDLSADGFLGEGAKEMLEHLFERLGLSARAYSRIVKIARTIADLEGCEAILPQHLAEAASYRFLDKHEV